MENTIRTAALGIAEELRNMQIGDIVRFPIPKYNYNSVRSTPGTSLVSERMGGARWRTRLDMDNKCVEVIRTA